jgi:DNA polymerase bacteriophage-type
MLLVAKHASIPTATDDAAHVLYIDVETRSPLRLRDVGAFQYARNSQTEIICLSFARDNEPPQTWVPGTAPIPQEFHEAACNSDCWIIAHNANFELAIARYVLEPRFNFPHIPLSQWRCTQAQAVSAALPGRLDRLADALETGFRKDVRGQRLMMMMSRPRRTHKGKDATQTFYFCDKDRLQRLASYCEEDARITREIFTRLPLLSAQEQALWQLDACINARGFSVDVPLARAAHKVALAAGPEINAELAKTTGGAVTSVHQIAKLQIWLQQNGCTVCSLDKKTVEVLLKDNNLSSIVRRALELRQDGGQAAAKKLGTLLATVGDDGRIRGAFKFHAAATGRWGGSHFQPQNLKRAKTENIDDAIAAISTGSYEHVQKLFPQPLSVIGDISRSLICAAAGKTLIGADFAAIESRILAWIANERWKIDAYCRHDATGDANDEPYRITAARIFHVAPDKITKEQRAIGKTCDLAFGYQGGTKAFRKFSDQFTEDEIKKFNREWRAAHPAIRKFWFDLIAQL